MRTIDILGQAPKVLEAIEFGKNIATTKANVLITGEKGVGKNTLASIMHDNSSRKENPIKYVDCSQDNKTVENEILGYREKDSGKFIKGVLEIANGGTVVLANIDGIDEVLQKRLFKIFQELGDYEIDVRLIATTTKNLSKLVGSGRFYRALYTYFINTQINLPSLRDRKEDIPFVTKKILEEYCINNNKVIPVIEKEAMDKMLLHYWTQNIKEVDDCIKNTMQNFTGEVITESDLQMGEKKSRHLIIENGEVEGMKLMSLREAEKLLIKKALIHTSENRTQAAKILGVSIRTLRNKINEYRNNGFQYFVNLR